MFKVDFTYNEPRWGDVEVPVDTKDDAEYEALMYIKDIYPEAIDVEITSIKEVN